MSAHDSTLPGDDRPMHMRWDETGGSLSWKGWKVLGGIIATIFLGSGSFVGYQFVTTSQLNGAIKASAEAQDAKIDDVKAEVAKNTASVTIITAKIGKLDEKVDDVQDYQISQDARQEARRVTEDLASRELREREYDRIRELNETRLKAGKEPCSTRDCSN